MKKLITLSAFIALLFVSCDSPITNTGSQQTNSTQKSASSIIPKGATPSEADSIRLALWQQFQAKNGSDWQMRKSNRTGLPVSIFSGLTDKRYNGPPREAALAFLADHIALFGFESLNQLHYVKTQHHRGVSSVTFRQYYRGVPVADAQYKVHIRSNGKIGFVNGYYYSNIEVSTSPSLSANAAIGVATQDLELTNPRGEEYSTNLFVLPQNDGSFALAWKTTVFVRKPFTYMAYYIDAHSGRIIKKRKVGHQAIGTGKVFPGGKCRSSVSIENLYGLNNSGYLKGLYVDVFNSAGSEAYSPALDFTYPPSNAHFAEVSLYYYVDTFRRDFIENLDADNDLFVSNVKAYAHDVGHTSNAAWYYFDGTHHFYFNDNNEFAKVDKPAYHEYSHAVVYDINSGLQKDEGEEGSIAEGVPDYFAGSFTDYAKILDCTLPLAARNMENPYYIHYSDLPRDINGNVTVDQYLGAEFFSAILWDIRSKIGAAATDALVYEALYYITGSPDFLEFRDVMIAADSDVYSGSHYDAIRNTFADWGIGTHRVFSVHISGPNQVDPDEFAFWTANVSGNLGPVIYQWYRKDQSVCTTCWYPVNNHDNSYGTSFQNSTNYDILAGVKVVVTSAGETASNMMQITVSSCDDSGLSALSSTSDSLTILKRPPGPCSPGPTLP